MKLQVFVICFVVALAAACEQHPECERPDCACSEMTAPIDNGPQLVVLSFDDSAAKMIFDDFWYPDLFNRLNPDGCPISGTFFVPHEYSDYEVVNKLYNQGFEIGSHSITKNPLESYWKNLSKDDIIKEMDGQRTVISKFANIPATEIIGARLPLLKLNENSYKALSEAGFLYDNSWAILSGQFYYPFTLDFKPNVACPGQNKCVPDALPGFWIEPIIDWVDMKNYSCNKLLACQISGTEDELLQWMKDQFDLISKNNGAPISIIINYALFNVIENSRGAVMKFLDYLATQNNVFLVSGRQALEWSKKPVPVDQFTSCVDRTAASCSPVTCELKKGDETRYFRTCVACPRNYPWLDNPTGK